jgi:hypothetical protein
MKILCQPMAGKNGRNYDRKRKHHAPIPLHNILKKTMSSGFALKLQEYCEITLVNSAPQ